MRAGTNVNSTDLHEIIINLALSNMTPVTRKQTLRSLWLSYQKKDGCAWLRQSFFWYDTDFSEFYSTDITDYNLEKQVSCQKKDGHGHAGPFFFWYDDKDLKVYFLVTRISYPMSLTYPNTQYLMMSTNLHLKIFQNQSSHF